MNSSVKNHLSIDLQFCRSVSGKCPNAAVSREFSESLVTAINRLDEQFSTKHDSDSVKVPYHQKFRVSVAMCPNACSRPQIADIGIIGAFVPKITQVLCTGCNQCADSCREMAIIVGNNTVSILDNCLHCRTCVSNCRSGTLTAAYEGFRILLGGKLGRHPMLAKELPGIYSVEETIDIINQSLQYYLSNSEQNTRFGDLISEFHFSWLPNRFIDRMKLHIQTLF